MATVIIPDKICPHCGGNEWYILTYKSCGSKKYYTCIVRRRENSRSYARNNIEKMAMCAKEWRINHKSRINELARNYCKSNREKVLLIKKQYHKIHREEELQRKKVHRRYITDTLTDSYIRELFRSSMLYRGIKPNITKITQEEINRYRTILTITRNIKYHESKATRI